MRRIHDFNRYIKESSSKYSDLVDTILDKINRDGMQSLSLDERLFLSQYDSDTVDINLYNWLTDTDMSIDSDGNKLKYDEFDEDEDIFQNNDKLIRVINKFTHKKPFSNNADWGGGRVWAIDSEDNINGRFIYLGDDELVYMLRKTVDGEYEDTIISNIRTVKDLHKTFVDISKNKN